MGPDDAPDGPVVLPGAIMREVLDVLRSKPWETHRKERKKAKLPAAWADPIPDSPQTDKLTKGEECGDCGGHYMGQCWWWPLVGFKATILPRIWSQIAISAGFSALACYLHHNHGCSFDGTAHELTGIVLGFLLGFRVESCASRFQDGEVGTIPAPRHNSNTLTHGVRTR